MQSFAFTHILPYFFSLVSGHSILVRPNRVTPDMTNGMAESFIKTFKRDYVYMNELPDAVTVMEQLPGWFEDYNENHPHKGLNMRSPRKYRRLVNKLEQCPV